jgi:hypothetical protein
MRYRMVVAKKDISNSMVKKSVVRASGPFDVGGSLFTVHLEKLKCTYHEW